jgi:hypothetical protein
MTEDQKAKYANLIQLFGSEIITCFVSQTWSARQAAQDKVKEQLANVDPRTKDAMKSDINKLNLPLDQSFPIFTEFLQEALKDPVLKNFLGSLDLIQHSIPVYFQNIPSDLL